LPRRPPPMHKQQRQFNPPPPTQYNPKRWLNDENFCIQVGRSMFQSLTILGLGLGASKTEIRVHYQQLARKYHPDKNDLGITGLSASEASAFLQLLNNAHQYLKDRA
jgi:DnaJ-class molecular chaperone